MNKYGTYYGAGRTFQPVQ